jgi:hypothetical protein
MVSDAMRADTARVFWDLTPGWLEVIDVAGSERVSGASSFALDDSYHTTLDILFIGCRVCVRRQPQTCGEVVRVMPMTRRVVVRLDPRHPSWRGTLRSFRPERLVIYS